MAEGPLVSAHRLRERLDDPLLRIADTRWYLDEPPRGRREYVTAHLPGAVYVDLEAHLTGLTGPGRHPLPEPDEFAVTMGALGIGDEHDVVAYDDRGGAIAARLWWQLRNIGHLNVWLLDGGMPAWTKAGYPVTSSPGLPPPAQTTVRTGPTRTIDRETLIRRLHEVILLDARSPERYRGEVEPLDPVAGHIPGAVSAPLEENLDPDGCFLDPASLADRFRALGADHDNVVVSCGSGVTGCHLAVAMIIAGLPEPALYPGSWSDWCTADMPAATGPEPGRL
jgi:thiosulfate/3-mercaptopyruvate sulfurtransferase